MIKKMSRKSIFGAVLMLIFLLIGLFGNVTMNGEVVENRVIAVLISLFFPPVIFIVLGFIFGFMKDSILAFFKEVKQIFLKK